MSADRIVCPDCESMELEVPRRQFLKTAGLAAAAAGSVPLWAQAKDSKPSASKAENAVERLYKTLGDKQKKEICFAWDHMDPKRGLLRTRVSNNWHITSPVIGSEFFTKEQQSIIREVYEGIIHPDWHGKIDKQLEDDAGGYGEAQNIAIFGTPGQGKFEFVMTGRHMTIRCDGNSADHVAFGGPIFYGHAAQGFNEKANHPGNVFWPQAVAANNLYKMLSGKQQKQALVLEGMPREQQSGFRDKAEFRGIPVTELSSDQKEHLQGVLAKLIEPYRQLDRDEALSCLKAQGGLDACSLAYYQQGDIGKDKVWDNWRLEGPAFVWHFRGAPHVHVWVNVAYDPSVKLNA